MLCKQVRAQIAKKKLLFGEDCSAQINNATQMIARVAGITLGPKGRNILIQH